MDSKETKSYSKRYDERFKKDVVAHWIKNKMTAKKALEALGVSEASLHQWRKKYEFDDTLLMAIQLLLICLIKTFMWFRQMGYGFLILPL